MYVYMFYLYMYVSVHLSNLLPSSFLQGEARVQIERQELHRRAGLPLALGGGPCTIMEYTWALKKFRHPYFGVYVCTLMTIMTTTLG